MKSKRLIPVASLDVCADQCGAKCCKAPGHVRLTQPEYVRLRAIAKDRGVKLRLHHLSNRNVEEAAALVHMPWVMDLKMNDGQCPFLGEHNECTVYEDRPLGCQVFPQRPTYGCLLAPSDDPNGERVEVAVR